MRACVKCVKETSQFVSCCWRVNCNLFRGACVVSVCTNYLTTLGSAARSDAPAQGLCFDLRAHVLRRDSCTSALSWEPSRTDKWHIGSHPTSLSSSPVQKITLTSCAHGVAWLPANEARLLACRIASRFLCVELPTTLILASRARSHRCSESAGGSRERQCALFNAAVGTSMLHTHGSLGRLHNDMSLPRSSLSLFLCWAGRVR